MSKIEELKREISTLKNEYKKISDSIKDKTDRLSKINKEIEAKGNEINLLIDSQINDLYLGKTLKITIRNYEGVEDITYITVRSIEKTDDEYGIWWKFRGEGYKVSGLLHSITKFDASDKYEYTLFRYASDNLKCTEITPDDVRKEVAECALKMIF